jgi:pyridoxine kinase
MSQVVAVQFLSIQSWVCHGYVGNKCSLFGLQTLGIEVDPLNTVNFSNHTGYPTWKGEKVQGEQLYAIFEGLKANNLTSGYTHLLSGYVNSVSTLRCILKILDELKMTNPTLEYGCDPVLGDDGKLYVAQETVEIYKNEIIPKADYLFPNQTECEFLTNLKISNEKEAFQAIDLLHSKGVHTVIVKSLTYGRSDEIFVLGSTRRAADQGLQRFRMKVKKLNRYFSGTGDLFAALFMGWISKGLSVSDASEKTVNSLQAVVQRTMDENSKELLLIKSRSDIENPKTNVRAEKVE